MVGKLRLNEWTGLDGERRSKVQVVADAVQFLGAPTKAARAADEEPDEKPADRPAVGALPAQGQLPPRPPVPH